MRYKYSVRDRVLFGNLTSSTLVGTSPRQHT